MTEMVERVARAIAGEDYTGFWGDWIDEARAAIEAMREPTPAACVAGGSAYTVASGGSPDGGLDALVPAYRAMIDAALEGDKP